jgi:acyl-CoA synthetase (AMP-forming)/AMP-acid ligase II
MISGQDFTTGDDVGVAAPIGELPLGGQVEKGPFFTGDSSNKKKLAPLDASAGVRGILDQHADRTFNRPSVEIESQDIKWNYGDLKAHVDATATGLLELGVQKGDTIALWANSPAEKLLTELSAAVLGANLVEASSASGLSGAKVIVFDGSDSAAAVAAGAASGVKLQTAGAPVAGAFPFQDIPVYGPLFPDPLDAIPPTASDLLDGKYKQLGSGGLLRL